VLTRVNHPAPGRRILELPPKMTQPIATPEEFYAHALAIEREAAERYAELADWFETRSTALATLCRRLATLEREHFVSLAEACARLELPEICAGDYCWLERDSPEVTARETFYTFTNTRQLLEIALAAEKRAHAFFVWTARTAPNRGIRELASVMAAEENEHVAWVSEALERACIAT
jgi:rubrerythrin